MSFLLFILYFLLCGKYILSSVFKFSLSIYIYLLIVVEVTLCILYDHSLVQINANLILIQILIDTSLILTKYRNCSNITQFLHLHCAIIIICIMHIYYAINNTLL